MDNFVFDEIDSKQFHVFVTGAGVERAPARSYDIVSVAGRNGDLYYDNGKYENVTEKYQCIIMHNFRLEFLKMRCELLCKIGYKELRDSFHVGMFRKAVLKKLSEPKLSRDGEAGVFEVQFDCNPEWYLDAGQEEIAVNQNTTIWNDTNNDAHPLITIVGSGSFTIGTQTVTVAEHVGTIILDCDIGEAYYNGYNLNEYITLSDPDKYPYFPSGETAVTLSGVTLTIVPRWYLL